MDSTVKQLNEPQTKLEDLNNDLVLASDDGPMEAYENYKDKIANAKMLKQQLAEENKSKPIDVGSVWDASPSQSIPQVSVYNKPEPEPMQNALTSVSGFYWAAIAIATANPSDPFSSIEQPSTDESFAFNNNQPTTPLNDFTRTNNDNNFNTTQDYSHFASSVSPKTEQDPTGGASNSFNEMTAPDLQLPQQQQQQHSLQHQKQQPQPQKHQTTQEKKMYRVLFDFEARNPDELTLNPGDIITGSEVSCEPGWLSGELDGKIGLFPKSYVQPLLDDIDEDEDDVDADADADADDEDDDEDERPTSSVATLAARACEFIDSDEVLITDVTELHSMDMFIFKKIYHMDEQRRISSKESTVDLAFKQALKEFRLNLVSTYSVASSGGSLKISYKDLTDHFEQVILNVCRQEPAWETFPVTMGVNAFRGYLDEFRSLAAKRGLDKVMSTNRKRENLFMLRANQRRMKEVVERQGHKMFMTLANIPIVCELCTSFVKLGSRVLVCNDCKLTCHKKCLAKVLVSCRDNILIQQGKKLFGAPLERLVTKEERIPAVLEQLMAAIEMKGLYVEGLYRKSATQSKINELKKKLEEDRHNVDLNDYGVHCWTAVLKSFFREMPEPLMTFQLYDKFLLATAIVDVQERLQVIFSHISKLKRPHYDLLERLTFHLARVALVEHSNRMSANSLAIVFAPCILRTERVMRAQESFGDIKKQTICLECIITERMRQVKDILARGDLG